MEAYRTRQVEALLGDATLIRATIDVADGRDLPAVVAELARRNDDVSPPVTTQDRRAVRLEAEARLLLGDADGADRRLSTLHAHEPRVARGAAPRHPGPCTA